MTRTANNYLNDRIGQLENENIALQAQLKLAETSKNQLLFSKVISEASIVLFATDIHGIFTFSDGKGLKKLGLQPGQVVGMSIFDAYKNNADVIDSVKEALRGKEIQVVNKVGEMYFDTSYTPIFNSENEVTGIAGVAQDVTDKINYQKQLKESNKLLEQAQRVAHLGAWKMDIASGDSIWSDEFYRICGLEPRSVKPTADLGMSLIHPDDRERATKAISEAIQNKSIYNIEKRILRPNGEIRYVQSQGEIVVDMHGNAQTLAGSFLDITARKIAEIRLAENELKFREITNNSPLAVYVSRGIEQLADYITPTFVKLFGYTLADAPSVAQWWPLAYPDESYRRNIADEWQQKVAKSIQTNKSIEPMETEVHCKNGDVKTIIWHFISDGDTNWAFGQDITKMKEYELELLKSEAKFKDIFNNITESIIIVSFDGNIAEVNKCAELQYGYSRDEFLKLSPLSIIREDFHKDYHRFEQELKTFGQFEGETIDVRKDGSHFNTYVKGSVINFNNKPHLLAVVRDVTKRKIAEAELLEASELNNLIINNSPLGTIIYEEGGQCLLCNEEAAKIVGTSVEEALSLNFHEIQSWKDSGLYRLSLKTLKSGIKTQKLIHIKTSYKKDLWLECYLSSFHKKDKKHLLMMVNNATDKTKAQQDRERFFSTTLSLLCTASLDGYFMDMNPAWEKTLGYSRKELKSHKFLDFIHPDDIPSTLHEMENLGNGLKTINFTNRYRCKDGSFKYLNWSSTSYENIIYASAIDVTPIEIYKAELEKNTIELKRSNQELEQFAYVASHDLQEPLRKIKNFSQMLGRKLDDHLDDHTRGYMNSIHSAVSRMQSLINDLLAFSRVSSQGKEFLPTDLNKVLSDVKQLLELQIENTKTDLILQPLPVILADEGQIFQLFQNLIGNAIKFNDKDKPVIEIGIEQEDAQSVTLFVKDNGIGIDKEFSERIFTIFQRLHSREKYDGTGIGLSICKKIVERHNGTIWNESNPGVETTFYIKLNKNR